MVLISLVFVYWIAFYISFQYLMRSLMPNPMNVMLSEYCYVVIIPVLPLTLFLLILIAVLWIPYVCLQIYWLLVQILQVKSNAITRCIKYTSVQRYILLMNIYFKRNNDHRPKMKSPIHEFISVALWKKLYFNPYPPSAAYLRQWTGSSLVQIKACRLFGAKPLSKQMLRYCQSNP